MQVGLSIATGGTSLLSLLAMFSQGGDVMGEPSRRRKCGVQTVATTEGNDPGFAARERLVDAGVHSRPKSRCNTRTDRSSSGANDAARASEIATLRCLPPVQPTAIVM